MESEWVAVIVAATGVALTVASFVFGFLWRELSRLQNCTAVLARDVAVLTHQVEHLNRVLSHTDRK